MPFFLADFDRNPADDKLCAFYFTGDETTQYPFSDCPEDALVLETEEQAGDILDSFSGNEEFSDLQIVHFKQ